MNVVEICAGAGGQSLGLHKAGFAHELAVEIDETAAETLRTNLAADVRVGDVADPSVWNPTSYEGVTLFAGGVPCPPFSVAGHQLGSSDERDLFAWTVEQVGVIRPRSVMLENVRGLASPRFSAYRQRVLDRLEHWGYVGEWKLIYAADHGVPQLRPRFVLVALQQDDYEYFRWPEPSSDPRVTIGNALHGLMGAEGWRYADEWRHLANDIGPTLVGGSKKHGGADLGPTRARDAWRRLYVDGRGVADDAPALNAPSSLETMPRLTVEMTARVQGWTELDAWHFVGRKTSQYRQIGNAFPPPVAEAVGRSIASAVRHDIAGKPAAARTDSLHDAVYRALAASNRPLTLAELLKAENANSLAAIERKLVDLRRDFELEVVTGADGVERYRLGKFTGFTGQSDHVRHDYLLRARARVS